MEGYGPDTLAWLADHPEWDPRVRLAPAINAKHGDGQDCRAGRNAICRLSFGSADPRMMGDQEFDGLNRPSQTNGLCLAAEGMSFDLA
jgi:hypothetical protein